MALDDLSRMHLIPSFCMTSNLCKLFVNEFLVFLFLFSLCFDISIDTNIISSTSTSTCTYTDIDIEINVWSIDIEINVCSIPKFTCMFVYLWLYL